MSDIESESVIAQQKRYIAALEARIDGLKQDNSVFIEVVKSMANFDGRCNNHYLKQMAKDALKLVKDVVTNEQ